MNVYLVFFLFLLTSVFFFFFFFLYSLFFIKIQGQPYYQTFFSFQHYITFLNHPQFFFINPTNLSIITITI